MTIAGVTASKFKEYAMYSVERFTDDLKKLIRKNLAIYCHGADLAENGGVMFEYKSTVNHFLDVYDSKSEKIKKGLIGELLVHIVIGAYMPEFEPISPYFNLEERSIRKGFDLLLYDHGNKDVWITEVKSGEQRTGKDHDQTAKTLLADARDDLAGRISSNELNHWRNAIHAVRSAVSGEKDYKDVVVSLLQGDGEKVISKSLRSVEKPVVLVAVLFHTLSQRLSEEVISEFSEDLRQRALFKSAISISVQKETIGKVVDFLRSESEG